MLSRRRKTVNKKSVKLLFILAVILMLYYVIVRAFPMLIVTEAKYGAYFYPRAMWLFPHIVLGIIAILVGPLQFIEKFRNNNLSLHRKLGKFYVFSVILSGFFGMYLAITSKVNLTYTVGLFFLGVTWTTTAVMAWISIKKMNIEVHKEWMIRSYVITFSFVTFRLFVDAIHAADKVEYFDVLALMAWASWAVPLFIAELFIQGRKL